MLTPSPDDGRETALRASIIIPTYNRRDILLQTLASLGHQSADPASYEVIVAVDASTDGTVEALEGLRTRYSLRWVVFGENRGQAAGANAAVRLARHEVLIVIGDDMLAAPGMVAAHLEAHQRHGVVLVQGEYPLAPGRERSGASLVYERTRRAVMASLVADRPVAWHLWAGNCSVRRVTWLQVGGCDERSFRRYGCEDLDLGIRVAALGVPFIYEPRALSHHLHVITPRRFAQQAFSEGQAVTRVARKHGLPLASFAGSEIRGPFDRCLEFGWRHAPGLMHKIGGPIKVGLKLADLVRIRPAQIAAARLTRRYFRVGGITTERRRLGLGYS